ncbi:hypothetical protein EXE57_13850 [Nocardioides euryhalodurans]|uniref:Uncharacterized protein n=1 Tax=Nocardioides euryhalodurans TaxID=2518370 RepID=A0A4P7GQG4_9ACTN|nr:hypothetical protein EXE57_13850 [Nocardioides euryhalodurans]
MPGRGRPASSH